MTLAMIGGCADNHTTAPESREPHRAVVIGPSTTAVPTSEPTPTGSPVRSGVVVPESGAASRPESTDHHASYATPPSQAVTHSATSAATVVDPATVPTDAQLAATIKDMLERQVGLSSLARNMTVLTHEGTVILGGQVATAAEAEQVGKLVMGVPGVTSVINNLKIIQ